MEPTGRGRKSGRRGDSGRVWNAGAGRASALLHDRLRWRDPVTGWIAGLDLNTVGFVVVGLFAVVRASAAAYWRLAGGAGRRR